MKNFAKSSLLIPAFLMTNICCDWQRQAFEEDRATWLKHQFLNLSPFPDTKPPKSKSAFLICKCSNSLTEKENLGLWKSDHLPTFSFCFNSRHRGWSDVISRKDREEPGEHSLPHARPLELRKQVI